MSYKVALIADNHFIKCNDSYFVNGTYTKQYLKRFTSNFDELVVIARVRNIEENDNIEKLRESGGERVSFCELEDFYGIKSFFKYRKSLKDEMKKTLKNVDAIFIRMPCILTNIAISCAKELRIPFMLDVGADPDYTYRSEKTTIFKFLISKIMKKKCQINCKIANGVSYVTKKSLQNKYPCKAINEGETQEYFTANISNVDISKEFSFSERYYTKKDVIRLIHISNNIWINSGKGHVESLYVLKNIIKNGLNAQITFVGDDRDKSEILDIAKQLNIEDKVFFTGIIANREQYRKILIEHDILLFPSHSEGLPRAVIEAMATGMVCVSSNVGGIPELLDSDDIFDYSDVTGMSDRIIYLFSNEKLLNEISRRNYNVSINFFDENLKKEYDNYYGKVRKLIDSRR